MTCIWSTTSLANAAQQPAPFTTCSSIFGQNSHNFVKLSDVIYTANKIQNRRKTQISIHTSQRTVLLFRITIGFLKEMKQKASTAVLIRSQWRYYSNLCNVFYEMRTWYVLFSCVWTLCAPLRFTPMAIQANNPFNNTLFRHQGVSNRALARGKPQSSCYRPSHVWSERKPAQDGLELVGDSQVTDWARFILTVHITAVEQHLSRSLHQGSRRKVKMARCWFY